MSNVKKFVDQPSFSSQIPSLLFSLPVAYLFCFFSGQRQPMTVFGYFADIGYLFLSVFVFIPALFLAMVSLKVFFYGSVMSTQLTVSASVKKRTTILIFLVATPVVSLFQTEIFLWFTGRPAASSLSVSLVNGFYMILASLPSMFFGILEFKKKIATFEEKERLKVAL